MKAIYLKDILFCKPPILLARSTHIYETNYFFQAKAAPPGVNKRKKPSRNNATNGMESILRNTEAFLADLRDFLVDFMDPEAEDDKKEAEDVEARVPDHGVKLDEWMQASLRLDHRLWRKKPLSSIVGSKRLDYQILFPPLEPVRKQSYAPLPEILMR